MQITDDTLEESQLLTLNFGPAHPATHGTLHLIAKLDGERVRDAEPIIGYLHRGKEKMGEHLKYNQYLTMTDRMNYLSPALNNIGWCLAVEKLIGVDTPPRVKWVETISCELARIMDHMVCNGINAFDIGAGTVFFYMFQQREVITEIFEKMTGARLTISWPRVGGLPHDVPPDFKDQVRSFLKGFYPQLRECEKLLKNNRIFLDRTIGVGPITKQRAIGYGYTGPCLRAAGLEYDLRKREPYLCYDEVDCDVPVGTNGDVYDRFFVRMEECRQSARIIEQCLEKMPDTGPFAVDDYRVILPPKQKVYTEMEAMIFHFKLVIDGVKPPAGEIYQGIEAGNGELGFYIVSDGSGKPYRVKVRSPCLYIYSSYPELIRGAMICDIVAVLGSLNIIAGELDR